jgi:hypothetical protein
VSSCGNRLARVVLELAGRFVGHRAANAGRGRRRSLFCASVVLLAQVMSRPGRWPHFARQAMSLWRHGGVRAVQQRVFTAVQQRVFTTANYDLWVELYDAISEGDRSAIAARIQTFSHRPVLSILLPVSDPSERALLSTIESVRRQLYPLWELCVAGDASASAQVGLALEATGAARDERIRSVFGGEMRSMSTAANSALELATGEFVGLIECGDEVAEHGLYMAAEHRPRAWRATAHCQGTGARANGRVGGQATSSGENHG